MKFVVKHLVCLIFFAILTIVLYEVVMANCCHSKQQNYSDIGQAITSHISASQVVLNATLTNAVNGNWNEFGLIRKFLYVFHNKIYWIVVALLIVISYYELRSRQSDQGPIISNQRIPGTDYEQHKRDNTQKEVDKLVNSPEYQDYYENRKVVVVEKQTDDEDFIKDWQENKEVIYTE